MDSQANYKLRNLAFDPTTRTARKSRAGGRYSTFLLDDGTRIRKSGERQVTLSGSKILSNKEYILEGLRDSFIELTGPDGKVITAEMFQAMTVVNSQEQPPKPESNEGESKTEEPKDEPPPADNAEATGEPKPEDLPAPQSPEAAADPPADLPPPVGAVDVVENPSEPPSESVVEPVAEPAAAPTPAAEVTKPGAVHKKQKGKR